MIELRGISKSYSTPQGPVEAVRGIDVMVERGETVALLGPNGAGKSTTLDIVLGLLRPDAGTVSVFGAPPDEAIARGAVGAMLQTGGLIRDLDVRELLVQMASLYPKALDVDETIALAGIDDIAGRRTQKLSGGQTQRVRFALALVTNPDLLVLDEPTVAMDVESRHAFWTTMRDFARLGKTLGPATGGTTGLLSIPGGAWFPVRTGALHTLATLIPSYWLVQAAHVATGGSGWSSEGWLVVAAWATAAAAAAMWAYRRDTGRA